MPFHWKAVEQYFTVVLFVVQFYPVCNFETFINFGVGTVRSERLNCLFTKLQYDIKKRDPNDISEDYL